MAESQAHRYIARCADLVREKQPWLDHYQRLAETYLTIKADFTNAANVGAFLNDNIFCNVPQFAAHLFASVCVSMLWPDAARTFSIVPKPQLKNLQGVEEYFRAVTARMHAVMDNPEAGLSLALGEHCLEQGVFGTSGIATLEGPEDRPDLPLTYECWDVKRMFIDENRRGHVDTIFMKFPRTVRQVYEEYFLYKKPGDRVSLKVKEAYDQGNYDEKVMVIKVLEPRGKIAQGKKGVESMEYRTVHIDETNRVMMRESGYEELPVAVVRALKRAGEKQGRSFGMVVLPAAVNLNSLSQDIIVASEKNLNPPLLVLDDGRLGGAVIDTSAEGITVVNTAGRPIGENPIKQLFTIGETQTSKDLKLQLIEEVMQGFMLDRLLDLGNRNGPMMTAYETAVRNRLRGESTGSLFMRQIVEGLVPTIRRSYNILHRRGDFGDYPGVEGPGTRERREWIKLGGKDEFQVPAAVMAAARAGLEVYDIKFISPAQRFMQAEKLQGMLTAMDAKLAVASVRLDILDGTDLDKWAREVEEYAGSPTTSQRTINELKAYREELQKKQNAAEMLQAGQAAADIQAKIAQSRAALGTGGRG